MGVEQKSYSCRSVSQSPFSAGIALEITGVDVRITPGADVSPGRRSTWAGRDYELRLRQFF